MSPSDDANAQNPDFNEWRPRRAILALAELPPGEGQKGGFTVSLAFSHQDPDQPQDVDENGVQTLAVVDIAVMALVDIIKTTPPAFVERIEAIQTRFTRIAERIAAGDDPREAAKEEFGQTLVADPEAAGEPETPYPAWRVWKDGEWTILHVATGGGETTSSFMPAEVQELIASLREPQAL